MDFPIPEPTFASVDGYLAYQRQAVGDARQMVYAEADRRWARLSLAGCDRFAAALADLVVEGGALPLWRRAWWLHAIGGRPRAPFEMGTSPDLALRLTAALAPLKPPAELPRALARWWAKLIAHSRVYIASYTRQRVAGAAARLADEGLLLGPTPQCPPPRSGRRRRPYGPSDRQRVRQAAGDLVLLHRRLDDQFAALGPVCAACTRETGGCCSLTVPLIWREADYRLLALGEADVPDPLPETAGACPFLGPRGCRLPSERRPHICRSFLCERAEQALGDGIDAVRGNLERLNVARSRLG